jgi:hypothetical protein
VMVIEVKAAGYHLNRRSVEVPASGLAYEALPLVRITPTELANDMPAATGPGGLGRERLAAREAPISGRRIASYGLGGTAVAGLSVALYQYIQSNSSRRQIDDLKVGDAFAGGTEARYASLMSQLESRQTRAMVFGAVGTGALVGAAVLFFLSPELARGTSVSLLPGMGAGMLRVAF